MSELIKISLGLMTAVGQGLPVEGQAGSPTAAVTVAGPDAGAVSATVVIRGSNDGVAWVSLATISPNGSGTAVGVADWSGDYALIRADVTALSAGARVSTFVSVDQTEQSSEPTSSAAGARLTIADFGDSFVQQGNYGWRTPWGRTESGSIAGIGTTGLERKAAAGPATLTYTASTRSCSFNGGPATPLVDGFQIIPGQSPLTGLGITVRMAGLPATDASMTVTRDGTRPDEIVDSKSLAWWTNFFANQGYLIRVYGLGGGQIRDCFSIVDRAASFDLFRINCVTNDVAAGRTLEQIQADTITLLNKAYKKSRRKVGIVFGGCTFRATFSAAQSETVDAYNRWLPTALKGYPGVVARFPWDRLVNDSGTGANTLMMAPDNVHPSDPSVQFAGKESADYFGSVAPGTPWDFGSALGRYSATNPGGNRLLNPNPAGNTSGRPSAWNALAVDTTGGSSATVSKVPRTDGVAGEWARITGTALANNVTHVYTIPFTAFGSVAPTPGETIQVFLEVRMSGAFQMVPQLMFTENKDGNIVWSRVNSSSDLKSLQLTECVGVMCTTGYVWSDAAGVPQIDVRIGQRLNNGASGAILDIGRGWVGAPRELSIF